MAFGLGRLFYRKFQYVTRPLLPVLWVPLVYTILSSIGLILNFWTSGDMLHDEQFNKNPAAPAAESFDFIVVGSGSAGAVVANRLSQKYKVLLLEAGGEPNPLQYIPGFGVFFVNYPETDWGHRSVPQKYACLNSVNQQSSWSAGKTLGGTGTLNLMVHLRGHTKDFDAWAEMTGDPSWSWQGVLPFFKKNEDYEDGGDPEYHGFGGDLHVETPDYVGMGPEFVRAGEELGYPHTDLNAPFSEGFDLIKYPIQYGIRQGTYKAFLEPIRRRRRKNLVIRKFAHVNRVLFKDGNVAYGVEYDRQGQTLQAIADKEVILSAGTVNSAKLLMLSGIGPAAHLQEIGIPVIQDSPVGLNLQDHIAAYLGPFFMDQPRSIKLERDLTPAAFVQWFTGGRGILSTTGIHATGCISSSLAKARGEGDWPDIQYFLFGYSVFKSFGAAFARGFGLTLDEQNKYYEHAVDKKDSFIVAVSGARPFSRGFIKLGGRSPYDAPLIDPRYFSDLGNRDLFSMVEGIKIMLLLAENTTAMGQELGTRFTTELLPGCEHLPFRTDEYWECYARRYTVTLHHPVGTASMGQVVDTKLRVMGVQNLRVIDASVEPLLVVTNTQASTIMIGEKGSHMILEHWKEEEERAKLRQTQYGPPPDSYKSTNYKYGAPAQNLGQPEPAKSVDTKYGSPSPPPYFTPPAAAQQDTPPPNNNYGAPPQQSYGLPEPRNVPEVKYGSPEDASQALNSFPSFKYGSPSMSNQTPQMNYGAPSSEPALAPTPNVRTVHVQHTIPIIATPQAQAPSSSNPPNNVPDLSTYQLVPPKELSSSATSWWQKRSSDSNSRKIRREQNITESSSRRKRN